MVDAAFPFDLRSDKKKSAFSEKELERMKARGVSDLITYLEKQGGSVRYSGPVARFLKQNLKTPYSQISTGPSTLVRLAQEQGKVEIEKAENGTQFIMRLCS